ncbi:MAG: segregation/condensation protein A [Acidobacteriota bacterium]|nr:MAG: segregation/condensation protein A [Acidobacteriota bacterium]
MSTEAHQDRRPSHPAAARPGLAVELPAVAFEGPLDLLLHLVRSNDMDILDLPIAEVVRQYNAYLDRMRELDLEIASEYLLMAATLAHIKSRMMLPVEAEEGDGGGEDPRAELSRQLLEYERFRKAAEELAALESGRDLVFARPGPPPPELAGEVTIRADLGDLVRAFERVLARLEGEERVSVIRREDFRVQDKMQEILDRLARAGSVSFRELIEAARSRLERIVYFLALLELLRLRAVSAWQPTPRGEIRIDAVAGAEAGDA